MKDTGPIARDTKTSRETFQTAGDDLDVFATPPDLVEALSDSGPVRASGGMDVFWTGLAPFSVLATLVASVLALVLGAYLLQAELVDLAAIAGSVLAVGIFVLLPIQYHLVRARILAPIQRLEFELLGRLPWRPEGDLLLSSLRRTVSEIRVALRSMENELRHEVEHVRDLQARLDERAAGDDLADRVAEGLRTAESVEQFAAETSRLVRSVWPAEDLLILHRDEDRDDLSVLAWDHAGEPVDLVSLEGEPPRYRRASLPAPVKQALRHGFYYEAGLPFSQDPAFPQARSFVAMALEHRGGGSGVLLALSPQLDPPSAEPLRRSRALFSIGFGRAMYVRELEEAEIRDALTGAYTYHHFLSLAGHEVARSTRYARPMACLMIDVDNLRRVNAEHGAAAGDRAIAEVSRLVSGVIRSSDVLARITGGRLALLLPETGAEASFVVAERVRERVEEHPFIVVRGQVDRITVSVGIGIFPECGVTSMSLVDAAEKALLVAKAYGHNRVATIGGGPAPDES